MASVSCSRVGVSPGIAYKRWGSMFMLCRLNGTGSRFPRSTFEQLVVADTPVIHHRSTTSSLG